MTVKKIAYGKMVDGTAVDAFILENSDGTTVKVLTYGATLASIQVKDKKGKFADILLGYDSLEQYCADEAYLGAVVGRYANRIANGKFTLDGKDYTLVVNNGLNHLHGGEKGFNSKVWTGDIVDADDPTVLLSYFSEDGEEGYDGNLTVYVQYTLTQKNELKVEYRVNTDKRTVVNLTQHAYFNLAGEGNGNVLEQQLMLNAKFYTPVADENSIPTGEILSVKNTPMDFLTSTSIGQRINDNFPQLIFANGYDHNWVLDHELGVLGLAARVFEPNSGRVMEVFTTEPGVQFYTGNFLADINGKNGNIYNKRDGFCLETQHYPDSPNKPHFPTTVIDSHETYRQTTIFKFSINS